MYWSAPRLQLQGCIQVSMQTQALLGLHTFTPTGGVEVKGKGMMETFIWDPEEHPEEQYASVREQACEAAALINHISKRIPLIPPGLAGLAMRCATFLCTLLC